ncbi:class I SAM-dependent methyltransferase [Planomonospora sp. ID91781]|uniref:Ubiquinone/menaquinone biosynthesis methylase n=1 Tax=Planomonospora sphaerica TaxID=161355 RepID=A0A171DGN0_9ACTN|nr:MULTISPECIES: class I SAM-dependent methyltransferase [Planomonospora]MBG0824740.1 class I SAM-dependent methyltransferase [Planomonospora sp. ID91781]GAT68379.1 ubiquinone/menaquinone biosynthesis methylase [Planomonospora sphaerica]
MSTFEGRDAERYDRRAGRLNRSLFRRICRDVAAAVPRDGAVLDAGTGSGHLLLELARLRPDLRLTGVDLSGDMIAIGRRRVRGAGLEDRITLEAADVADLPCPDDGFDLVVSTLSMHHWDRVDRAVAEFARVLKPEGALWIYDFRFVSAGRLAEAVRRDFPGRPMRRTLVRALLPFPLFAGYAV